MESITLKSSFGGATIKVLLNSNAEIMWVDLNSFNKESLKLGITTHPSSIFHGIGFTSDVWSLANRQVFNSLAKWNLVTPLDKALYVQNPHSFFKQSGLIRKINTGLVCKPQLFLTILYRLVMLSKAKMSDLVNITNEMGLQQDYHLINQYEVEFFNYSKSTEIIEETVTEEPVTVNKAQTIKEVKQIANDIQSLFPDYQAFNNFKLAGIQVNTAYPALKIFWDENLSDEDRSKIESETVYKYFTI